MSPGDSLVQPSTPLHLRQEIDDLVSPAGHTVDEALRTALDYLCTHIRCATLIAPLGTAEFSGRVLLVSISPGTALCIGVSSLAEEVRTRLWDGFGGWTLAALPERRTPLHHLEPHLMARQYNLLSRREFSSTEEVAAMPTDAWTELNGVGERFVEAVESTVAELQHSRSEDEPSSSVPIDGGGSQDLHGWRLQVAPDGRSATVHAPDHMVISHLSGTQLNLRTADSSATAGDIEPGSGPTWTVDLAEQILRRARPTGATFLRALIDEGGSATAELLRQRTGLPALNHATQTLTTAAAHVLSRQFSDGRRWRHFFTARPHPNRPRGPVYDYHLPDSLIAPFSEALERL